MTLQPLKDLIRLKKIITNNSSEPVVEFPYPSRGRKIPRDLCLPVMKGLLAVLLSSQGACSVDFFVLICKVCTVMFSVDTRLKTSKNLKTCGKSANKFAWPALNCHQVWNNLLTTSNKLVDIIRVVTRLF